MSLLKQLLAEEIAPEDEQFNSQDVLSKLKSAEKNNKISDDAVGFVLEEIDKETGEVKMVKVFVKVFVSKEHADAFEKALSISLEDNKDKKEIAEILFDLREKFNIVNVEWPEIPEDEEVDQELAGEQGLEGEQDLAPDEMGATDELDMPPDQESEDKSTLQQLIDLMKSESEAKKAEAEAKKAEAQAEEAKYAAQTAMARLKTEEELIDMEDFEKEKQEKEKEYKQLSQLAKFRQQKANDLEGELNADSSSMDIDKSVEITPESKSENEEVIQDQKPDQDGDGYLNDEEYLAYIKQFLMKDKAQR